MLRYNDAMSDFEQRWQRIAHLLNAEASGNEHPMISSGRTLFGIKSNTEAKMDAWAQEIEDEYATARKDAKNTTKSPMNTDDLIRVVHRQLVTSYESKAQDALRKAAQINESNTEAKADIADRHLGDIKKNPHT